MELLLLKESVLWGRGDEVVVVRGGGCGGGTVVVWSISFWGVKVGGSGSRWKVQVLILFQLDTSLL